MSNNKDGRIHRGMYINDRLWLLAWFGGRVSKRSRPDYIAHSLENQLKGDGFLNSTGKIPKTVKARIIKALVDNPPDSRTVSDMLDCIKED
jgi:hypothetical protein